MKPTMAWSRFTPQITTRNLIVLSALLVALFFLLQGDVGFNLSDEGFLWYGTIQTALGQVPIRDFQSYEPGRYYWGAFWFKLLGSDGILTLRLSQAVFQFIGLTLGLLLLRRLFGSWIALTCAAIILLRWMVPTWKIYEPVILIAAIYFAVLLIEQPSVMRQLAAGIFVGLAAFFGRNHGLYCAVAYVLLTFYLSWTNDRRVLPTRLGALSRRDRHRLSANVVHVCFCSRFFCSVHSRSSFQSEYRNEPAAARSLAVAAKLSVVRHARSRQQVGNRHALPGCIGVLRLCTRALNLQTEQLIITQSY